MKRKTRKRSKNDSEFLSLDYWRVVEPLKIIRNSEGKTDLGGKRDKFYIRL